MTSALKLINLSTESNSVDPDETATRVWPWYRLFEQEASKTFRHTTKSDEIRCDWRFKKKIK